MAKVRFKAGKFKLKNGWPIYDSEEPAGFIYEYWKTRRWARLRAKELNSEELIK